MATDGFRWEFDPNAMEESARQLMERLRKLVDQGRYTKVRLKYKGRTITPDIPLATLLAVEGLSLIFTGPLQVLFVNLGVKAFVDVELVHDLSEKVQEGKELFEQGEVDAAEEKYREALAIRPDDPNGNYALGVLLRVTGRRDEAIACFEKVVAHADHPDAAKAQEALDKMKRGKRTL